MGEIFCLRLAFGMMASLLVLDSKPIPPRFFRVQFLVSLALITVAWFFLFSSYAVRKGYFSYWYEWNSIILTTSGVVCFFGCISWHLDNAPGGMASIRLTFLGLGLVLFLGSSLMSFSPIPEERPTLNLWPPADNYASAAMLGTATTAMLLGHSYLISPAMSIVPLQRMLIALAGALAFRVSLACWGLYWWTAEHPLRNLETETLLWLSARWLLGIFGPLLLGWMAWETARIRSTQSATGILYVVVIVTFLGELTSLLLLEKTGYPL